MTLRSQKEECCSKGTQDDCSTEDSANEDDLELAFVIKKANEMMRRKFL